MMKQPKQVESQSQAQVNSVGRRALRGMILVCVLSCAVAVWSNISSHVVPNGDMPRFYVGPTFPPGIVAGHDFWITYNYAKVLLGGGNAENLPPETSEQLKHYYSGPRGVLAYPPFVFMVYAPYTVLPYPVAYAIQSFLLFVANLLVVGLICRLVAKVPAMSAAGGTVHHNLLVAVFASVSFAGCMSYGYLFSVERGNSDAFAMLLITGFLYRLVAKPGDVWGPSLLLTLAIHIKITPLLFGALLFWRHRFKCLIPMALLNIGLLLVWGPDNARLFIKGIMTFGSNPDAWWGDHSIYSYVASALKPADMVVTRRLLTGVVAMTWFAAWVVLWRRGFTIMNGLLLYCISVPVMMVLPSSSNDYKLVMLGGAMAVLMAGFLFNYVRYKDIRSLVAIVMLWGLSALLMTSGGLMQSPLWMNKCSAILALMLMSAVVIVAPWGVFASYSSGSESSGKT